MLPQNRSIPPHALVAAGGAAYLGLALTLPDWWTRTNYCANSQPYDLAVHCTGVPPLMVAFAVVGAAVAVLVYGPANRGD